MASTALEMKLVRTGRASREELHVATDGVERIAQLVGDGAGELAERRQLLLGAEIAARLDEGVVQLRQRAVLAGQVGRRVVHLLLQLAPEAADAHQHGAEAARQRADLV